MVAERLARFAAKVNCRPILRLDDDELDRIAVIAASSSWTISETVEAIVRDWLEQDREELEALGPDSSYGRFAFLIRRDRNR